MLKESNTNIERIIAKIDNDFNPDNSDWIPRVGAWCIDAMSQITGLPTEITKRTLEVKNRIAYSQEELPKEVKVYTNGGCRISNINDTKGCNCNSNNASSPTGGQTNVELSNTMSEHYSTVDELGQSIAIEVLGTYPVKHEVQVTKSSSNRNYILIGKHQIELNFDTDCIVVEYERIKTECSELYGCELPVIPNNGTLIEAIVYYCIYKMLCRGYKHQVFNLAASQYGTNPYYIWTQMKEKAKRSIINNGFEEDVDKIWRSAMFIHMFDPRR